MATLAPSTPLRAVPASNRPGVVVAVMAPAMARPVLMAVVVTGTAVIAPAIATPAVMPAVVVVAEPLFVGGRRA